MRRYNTKIWTVRTMNLVALVAMGAMGAFWAQSAGNSVEKSAMFTNTEETK